MLSSFRLLAARFALAAFALSTPSAAVTPYLVTDLKTDTEGVGSNPYQFVALGSRALFFSQSPPNTWSTDGTAAGTVSLGSGFSPDLVGKTAHKAILERRDSPNEPRLWVSDGTPAGTFELSSQRVSQIAPLSRFSVALPGTDRLFFAALEAATGVELWVTDGTRAGTRTIDLRPGPESSFPSDFFILRNHVYFSADDGRGISLWTTDGTAQGTRLVFDPDTTQRQTRGIFQPTVVGNTVYFFSPIGDGWFLWRSNGEPNGTVKLLAIPTIPGAFPIVSVAPHLGKLFFVLPNENSRGDLWVTNGTIAGTRRLTVSPQGAEVAFDLGPFQPRGRFVFKRRDLQHGDELWTTDGSPQGTKLLRDFKPGPLGSFPSPPSVAFRGKAYFWAQTDGLGEELWSTDGTPAGTRLLADFCPGGCSGRPSPLGILTRPGNPPRLLLSATDSEFDSQALFASDGTTTGTLRLATQNFSSDTPGVVVGGRLIFAGSDAGGGAEPWQTDGTATGTGPIVDLVANRPGNSSPHAFIRAGSKILFAADLDGDGTTRARTAGSDGTAAGTVSLELPLPRFQPLQGAVAAEHFALIPTHREGESEMRLYRSDGTPSGTFALLAGLKSLYSLTIIGNRAYFIADDGTHGDELWTTDGTVAGTRMIVDRNPGPEGSTFERLRSFLGRLVLYDRGVGYDLVSDGTSLQPFIDVYPFLADFGLRGIEIGGKALIDRFTPPNHVEPWITDGTAAGTMPLLGDLAEGLGFEASGDRLLFVRSEGDTQSTYFSNGTPEGTRKIATGVVPSFEFNRVPFSQAGARWVFSAVRLDDGARAIWATDGTPEGTGPVLLPTEDVGLPNRAAPFAGRLLLAGRALWITDGTPAGTEIVIEPDGFFGDAPLPVVAGDRAFYSRFDEETGQELWALRP